MLVFVASYLVGILWLLFSDYWKNTNSQLKEQNKQLKRIADALERSNEEKNKEGGE